MKPVIAKTEIEKTPAEHLRGIQWAQIDCNSWSIWFKSCFGITEMQIKILELLLTKSLAPQFELGDSGLFYHQGQVSFTVLIKLDHPFWNENDDRMKDFADNPIRLFSLT